MSRKVTKIPQIQQDIPIEARHPRVAAYCRVSTRHEEQCHSLEAQISYHTNYIQRNPNWKFVAVYSNIASGSRTANRPGYQKLMGDCTKRMATRGISKRAAKSAAHRRPSSALRRMVRLRQ